MTDNADLETLIAQAIMAALHERKAHLGGFHAIAAAKNVLVELHVNGYEVVPHTASLQAP